MNNVEMVTELLSALSELDHNGRVHVLKEAQGMLDLQRQRGGRRGAPLGPPGVFEAPPRSEPEPRGRLRLVVDNSHHTGDLRDHLEPS